MNNRNDPQVEIKLYNIKKTLTFIDHMNDEDFKDTIISIEKDVHRIIDYLNIEKKEDKEQIRCC